MKYFILFALSAFGFSTHAAPVDCMCTKDVIDCRVGKLTCSGEFTNGGSKMSFSDSQVFGPDDGFVPSVSMQVRDFDVLPHPDVIDMGFYASSCDGVTSKIEVSLLHWLNVQPNYPVQGRDAKNFVLEHNKPIKFDLKVNKNQFSGTCLLEKL